MRKQILFLLTLTLGFLTFLPTAADAQIRANRITTRQVDTVLRRIETRTDNFKRQMETSLDRSMLNNTNQEDRIMDFIRDFEVATDVMRNDYVSQRDLGNQLNDVMNRASFINQFMLRNRLNTSVENQWNLIRADLNTLAGYYTYSWDWTRIPTYPTKNDYPGSTDVNLRVTTRQVDTLLRRVETRTDAFKRRMETSLDRSMMNNTNREERIMDLIREFEVATDAMHRDYNRRDLGPELTEVMNRAALINRFMERNRLNTGVQNQWNLIRNDLNTLAGYYTYAWDWNNVPTIPGNTGGFPGNFDNRLTGTYRLNQSLSDNVSAIVTRETASFTTAQRDRMRRNLERRLGSPDMLAIDVNNRSVTMASSLAPQVTFEADGVGRTETNDRGRTITTTARVDNSGLNISYVGERSNDFTVAFVPYRNNQLQVTRRIYLEGRNDEITVTSVYDKIDNVARWSNVNTGGNYGDTVGGTTGDFLIPNGTRLIATLQNPVNSRASQAGDRVTFEVTSPSVYRGAIIEGRVAEADRSGRFTGRANISFEFDSLRMNGRTYRFAGVIDSVRALNGDNVSVNNEGTVRDSNQTTRTITRAGIGGVLGALIGAIAGGGEGAAIGAAVGAGAGAGTVLIQGRDNIELERGSEFTITASAPTNVGYVR